MYYHEISLTFHTSQTVSRTNRSARCIPCIMIPLQVLLRNPLSVPIVKFLGLLVCSSFSLFLSKMSLLSSHITYKIVE